MIIKKISLWVYVIFFISVFWININSVSDFILLETGGNAVLNKDFLNLIATSPQKIMFNGIAFYLPFIYITRKDWLSVAVLIRLQEQLNRKSIFYALIIASIYTALTYLSIVVMTLILSIGIDINLVPFILKSIVLYIFIYTLYLILYTAFNNHTIAILVIFFIGLCYSSIYLSLNWVGLDVGFMMGFWNYPIILTALLAAAISYQIVFTKRKDYL